MSPDLIATLLSAVITILALFGVSLVGFKKVLTALAESGDVLSVSKRIFADNKVTPEEVEEFIKELNEAKGAWQEVTAKKG